MPAPRFPRIIDALWLNAFRPPELIRAWSDRQVRRLTARVEETVPFYRSLWRAAGVSAADIRSLADLPRLPLVDKSAIVEAGAAAYDPGIRWTPDRIITTSGTSGRAIQARRTRREEAFGRRAVLRQLLLCGGRPLQRHVLYASGWLKNRKGRILKWLAPTIWFDASAPIAEVIAAFQSFRPHGLIGQTGGMYLLAREILRRGLQFPLKVVVPTGTTLVPEMRRVLTSAFAVPPCDLYGAIEVGTIAWQCRQGNYHIDADRIAVEIVDEQGRVLPPGEFGQVVVTALYQYAMPFIRYRLLDIAALSRRTCACGCRLPLLEPIQGRINDFLPTPAGDLVSPHFFFHIFDRAGGVPVKEWRVIQDDLHHLTYEYVPEEGFLPAQLDFGVRLIRERFGPDCQVRSVQVDQVPMSPTGKRTCIVSHLRPQAASRYQPWTGADPAGAGARIECEHPAAGGTTPP